VLTTRFARLECHIAFALQESQIWQCRPEHLCARNNLALIVPDGCTCSQLLLQRGIAGDALSLFPLDKLGDTLGRVSVIAEKVKGSSKEHTLSTL
jgi:hypothetical protein